MSGVINALAKRFGGDIVEKLSAKLSGKSEEEGAKIIQGELSKRHRLVGKPATKDFTLPSEKGGDIVPSSIRDMAEYHGSKAESPVGGEIVPFTPAGSLEKKGTGFTMRDSDVIDAEVVKPSKALVPYESATDGTLNGMSRMSDIARDKARLAGYGLAGAGAATAAGVGISDMLSKPPQYLNIVQKAEEERKAKQAQTTTTVPSTETKTAPVTEPKKTGYDLPKEWSSMQGAYEKLGDQYQGAVKASYDNLATALKELNEGFGEEMRMAKDKAEKQKTRAEWASIASMLAKNVVGFGAALQGVDPKAMAYETMDWGKRIADINDEMKINLDDIRARMKDRVEEKKAEAAGIKEGVDASFSAQLKGLGEESRRRQAGYESEVQRARDVFSAEAQAERDRLKEEGDIKAMEAKAATERTTVKPEDLRNTLASLGKAKTVKEAAQIAATAGVDSATLDKLSDKYTSLFGNDEVGAVAAFSQAVRDAAAARGGVTTTTTTGQAGGNVVQSPVLASTLKTVPEGTKGQAKDGTPVVYRNGQWVPQ